MHKHQPLVETRIDRFVRERIARRSTAGAPRWPSAGGRCRASRCRSPRRSRAGLRGRSTPGPPWGRPWGDDVVPRHRGRAGGLGAVTGTRLELVVDLGFTDAPARVPGRGHWSTGRTARSSRRSSRATGYVPARTTGAGRAGRTVLRSRPRPTRTSRERLELPADAARATRRRPATDPLYRLRARRRRRARRDRLGAAAGPRGPSPACVERAARRPAAARESPARPGATWSTSSTRDDVAGTAAAGRGRARGPCCARPRHAERAPGRRRRARPHRLGLAVAGARDGPQVRPHVLQRARPDGRATPTSSSPARRRSSTPGCSDAYPELFERIRSASAEGRFVPGRRHVGRVRHQHARRRGAGPAVRRRASGSSSRSSASSRTRSGCRTPSATPAALPQIVAAAGSRWFLTQKISWNETNRHAAPHVPLGGHRRHAGSSPTSRRSTPTTPTCPARSWPAPSAHFTEKGRGEHVARAVRLRRRRRRPHPRDARGGRAGRRRPRGLAAGRARRARRRSSGTPQAEYARRRRCGRASSTWSSTAAPTPPRPGPSGATAAASTCCARPSCGRRPRAVRAGAAYPYDELERGVAARCCCSSSTTSCPARRSPGCTARPRQRLRRGRPRRWSDVIADRARAPCAGAGAATRWRFNAGPYARRRACRRSAAGRRCRAVGPVAPRRRDGDGFVLENGRDPRPSSTADGLLTLGASTCARGARGARPGCGAADLLQLHRDTPNQWDAWDIDAHYQRNGDRPASRRTSVESSSDAATGGRAGRRAASATRRVDQTITLRAGAARGRPRASTVDWHERQKLLKLAFPLDVHADRAASEIQFGHLTGRRTPTRRGTRARFETVRPPVGARRASPATASPWPTTRRTATTSAASTPRRRRHDDDGAAVAAARAAVPRPRAPTRASTCCAVRWSVGAGIPEAVREGYRHQPAAAGGRRRGVRVEPLVARRPAPAIVVEAVKLAEDRQRRRGRAALRGARRPGPGPAASPGSTSTGITETDLLERPLEEPRPHRRERAATPPAHATATTSATRQQPSSTAARRLGDLTITRA